MTAPLFSHGFRPFFLGAAIYTVLVMAFWLAWISIHAANAVLTWISIEGAPHVWHAHEMAFGFGLAAVAGFLLTAVPNWTGAVPVSGRPLMVLFGLWLLGRAAMMTSAIVPTALVAAIDLAFIPALGLHVTHQLFVRPQARNLIFLALLTGLFLANVTHHLAAAGLFGVDPLTGSRAGVLTLVVLIVIIGGRIVPGFTHNHLQRVAPGVAAPVRSALRDRAALASTVVFVLLALAPVGATVLGVAAGVAAVANAVRLAGWRGQHTLTTPIVAVLHAGYLWIVIGLAVWCAAQFSGGISEVSALHALSTGAVGTMVLAVMTRASLGHTGRPLVAPRPIVAAYILVGLAALARTFGPMLAIAQYNAIMLFSGVMWMTAFGIFAWVYFPMLTQPRMPAPMRTA